LLCLNIFDYLRKYSSDKNYVKIKKFENSNSKSFLYNFFFTNQIYEMKKFREINCNDILINTHNLEKNKNPDVSVIITAYNQANKIYSALRSVQNQSLKNIEIIIVDDCSLDNTTEVIEKYLKEDKRIIYLRHKSNDGKIKSRSDGIRMAKGKYITIIDGDDALSNSNILYNSFTIANLGDLDIVQFRYSSFRKKVYITSNSNLDEVKNLNNHIIYQPELAFKFVDLREKESITGFSNRNIVSKLIKNEVFKKVLKYIGSKYTEDYLLDYEDTIMSVSLFRIANSFYYMLEYGYYIAKEEFEEQFPFLKSKKCLTKSLKTNKEIDPIKYLNFLLDKSNDSKIENNLIYKELIAINYYKKLDMSINTNFSYVYFILDWISKSQYLSIKMKMKIYQIKEKLMKKEKILKFKK